MFLHQSAASQGQVLFWDRWLVRSSMILDPLVAFQVGKSIIGVWTKK
jgi:hypothetical protein